LPAALDATVAIAGTHCGGEFDVSRFLVGGRSRLPLLRPDGEVDADAAFEGTASTGAESRIAGLVFLHFIRLAAVFASERSPSPL
jgi:hypothetical protein